MPSPPCGARGACEDAHAVQRTSDGNHANGAVDSGFDGRLRSGAPLGPGVRGFFESRFGQDFGDVRVHADGQVGNAAARSVNALAFTIGRSVAFRAGQYSPDTPAGRKLLAHELTHVVQQRGSDRRIQRKAACPARPAGEAAQSRTPGGILATNVLFTSSAISQLDVMDFAVNSADLPPGTTSDMAWQRALSIMGGDPSIRIQVAGYTDCAGGDAENVSLREGPHGHRALGDATTRGEEGPFRFRDSDEFPRHQRHARGPGARPLGRITFSRRRRRGKIPATCFRAPPTSTNTSSSVRCWRRA